MGFDYQGNFYVSKQGDDKMRRGKLTLTLLAVMALVVIADSGAYAAVPAPEYVWSPTGAGSSSLYTYSITLPSDWSAGNSFAMYDWGNSANTLTLVKPATGLIFAPVTISGDAGSGYTATSSAGSLNLGDTPQFGFSFSNPTSGTFYTYTLASLYSGWTLTNDDIGSMISVQGSVAPSAVPIPGSVLLFGSGLLGLLGIGSRRDKEQSA